MKISYSSSGKGLGRGYRELFLKKASSYSCELFWLHWSKKKRKGLTIEVFSHFPQVFQKEFREMHGVKQAQRKFIIVKCIFKKTLFPR